MQAAKMTLHSAEVTLQAAMTGAEKTAEMNVDSGGHVNMQAAEMKVESGDDRGCYYGDDNMQRRIQRRLHLDP